MGIPGSLDFLSWIGGHPDHVLVAFGNAHHFGVTLVDLDHSGGGRFGGGSSVRPMTRGWRVGIATDCMMTVGQADAIELLNERFGRAVVLMLLSLTMTTHGHHCLTN